MLIQKASQEPLSRVATEHKLTLLLIAANLKLRPSWKGMKLAPETGAERGKTRYYIGTERGKV